MIRRIALVLGFASLALTAEAAVVSVVNSDFTFSGNDLLFIDNAGNPLSRGFVALYATAAAPASFDLPSATLLDLEAIGPANSPNSSGLFAHAFSFTNDGSLLGQEIVVLVGNGADPAGSSQLCGLFAGLTITQADGPDPWMAHATLSDPSLPLLPGTFRRPIIVDASSFGAASQYNTFMLSKIPEPGAPLLLSVAGVLVCARRGRRCQPPFPRLPVRPHGCFRDLPR